MADDFKNETYLALMQMLGPEKSGLLIEQLLKDVISARNDLIKAQSKRSIKLLDTSTHVLSSLAGTVGAQKVHQLARDVNDQVGIRNAHFPNEDVVLLLSKLEPWIDFLLSESQRVWSET